MVKSDKSSVYLHKTTRDSNALDEYVLKMGLDIPNGLLSVENKSFKITSIDYTGFVRIKKKQI